MRPSVKLLVLFTFFCAEANTQELDCHKKGEDPIAEKVESFNGITQSLLKSSSTVFQNLGVAIETHTALKKPNHYIETGDKNIPKFPSYSDCQQTFFRVATVPSSVDDTITEDGWKSGWMRRQDELKKAGKTPSSYDFDGMPPERALEDRVVEYVRVKNVHSQFPKHSSVVGVLMNPIRTMSVGYHTGYNAGMAGNHMRMDEIEIGSCARNPICRDIKFVDSTEVFKKKNLIPRYSTEGEWAVDLHIPAACVVATYRTRFHKVDDVYYSDSNGNISGGK